MQTHVVNKIGVLIITLCLFISLFVFKFLAIDIHSKFLITAVLGLSGISLVAYARYKEQDNSYFIKVGFGLFSIILMIAFYFVFIK